MRDPDYEKEAIKALERERNDLAEAKTHSYQMRFSSADAERLKELERFFEVLCETEDGLFRGTIEFVH